jgi:hypothetical protein
MLSTAPSPQHTSRGNRLRALIDDLILFGRLLIEALQNEPTSEIATRIISRFNGRSVAAIIARITRGIMLATALDTRVQNQAKRIDNPPPPRLPDERKRTTRQPRTKPLLTDDDDALLARMPTAEEIARNIRTRPIGAVLGDIARDLGLNENDPLWMQIYGDILQTHSVTGLRHLLKPRRKPSDRQRRKRRQPPPPARAAAPPPPQPTPTTGPPEPAKTSPRVRQPPDLQWQWVPVPVFHKHGRPRSFRGELLSSAFSGTRSRPTAPPPSPRSA